MKKITGWKFHVITIQLEVPYVDETNIDLRGIRVLMAYAVAH